MAREEVASASRHRTGDRSGGLLLDIAWHQGPAGVRHFDAFANSCRDAARASCFSFENGATDQSQQERAISMRKNVLFAGAIAAFATGLSVGGASAQPAASPNFSGTYRCEPEPTSCQNSGQTFTVTQSGNTLELKSDNGAFGEAKLTSNTTMSVGGPWNMLGVVLPDGRIQWSNGTVWRKQ
jgi:hypothetical protein